jgi:chorismate mutase
MELLFYKPIVGTKLSNDRVKKAAKKELTEDFVKDLMEAVHQESIRHQTKIMNNILAE